MNLDNGTTHHPSRFNQSNLSKLSNQDERTSPAEPSKTTQWMITLRNLENKACTMGTVFWCADAVANILIITEKTQLTATSRVRPMTNAVLPTLQREHHLSWTLVITNTNNGTQDSNYTATKRKVCWGLETRNMLENGQKRFFVSLERCRWNGGFFSPERGEGVATQGRYHDAKNSIPLMYTRSNKCRTPPWTWAAAHQWCVVATQSLPSPPPPPRAPTPSIP